ncbi:hypothetical protein ACVW0Y_003070 [Pseudomonas sp. TE3786]
MQWKWLTVLFAGFALAACGEPNRFGEGWNKGGTLHDANMREWALATDSNRLATSADLILEQVPALPADALDLASELFEKCLTDSAMRGPYEYRKVRDNIDSCLEDVLYEAQRIEAAAGKRGAK